LNDGSKIFISLFSAQELKITNRTRTMIILVMGKIIDIKSCKPRENDVFPYKLS
tara:strand:- start:92 stop:253 length:162 start_codon:yes stop_codon:yes gene_type:complete